MGDETRDFFISHSSADERWAEWIALQLEKAGYAVELDLWEWSTGTNFISAMETALQRTARVIAIYSGSYFTRPYAKAEHYAAIATSFHNQRPRIVPVQIEECEIPELYRALIRINLVNVDEQVAIERLLKGVADGSVRKRTRVEYPGAAIPGTLDKVRYPGKLPSMWRMPPRNHFFVGRRALIEKVGAKLRQFGPQGVAVTSLHGIGGIGKTQIAIEYAYKYADDYNIVWWVDADSSNLIVDGLLALAEELSLSSHTPEQAIEKLWSQLARRYDWLLIYDNVDDVASVNGLRPPATGHWLITSRNPSISRFADVIEVSEFDRSESLGLLGIRVPALPVTEADLIAEALGDLPLAVEQASYFLADTGFTADEYLLLLNEEPIKAGLVEATIDRHPGLTTAVVTTIDRLQSTDSIVAHTLNLLSILAPEPLPVTPTRRMAELSDASFGVRFGGVSQTAYIIRGLARSGLVKRIGRSLQMHRLIQIILAGRLAPEAIYELEAEAALLLAESVPGDPANPSSWPQFALLLPHVEVLASRNPDVATLDSHGSFAKLIVDCIFYLYRTGRYKKGLELALLCMPFWKASLGETAVLTLKLKNNLGTCMTGLGNYAAATELYRELHAQYTEKLGPLSNYTLRTANNIGVTLNGSKKFSEAVEILAPALEKFREVVGETDPETLRTADTLATALIGVGVYDEAVQLATNNLELRRQVFSPEHPDTLESAYTLGEALSYSQPEHARTILEATLALQSRILGPDHLDTIRTASTLERINLHLST